MGRQDVYESANLPNILATNWLIAIVCEDKVGGGLWLTLWTQVAFELFQYMVFKFHLYAPTIF